ncbi:MAG TPA: OmpA family protein [Vitreimonas sp.]|uniref:OmpA family protein n=1 Tax=Vitreimonas sp. TaxID=3069702 RepID=UPI002D4D731C|nr:OmpA family protein [Vitreimonas sp.]HYD85923.1 OmpA family protein [Vitreimonas sp.]
MLRPLILACASAALLSACAATQEAAAPFDPANCYQRDFNIYFVGQGAELSEEARQVMDGMGEAVRGCQIREVRVIGETDARGGAVSNDEVSEQRAQVIAEYLSQRVGWPRSRMTVAAAGERGAVTEDGLNVPVRRRARVIVEAEPPQ